MIRNKVCPISTTVKTQIKILFQAIQLKFISFKFHITNAFFFSNMPFLGWQQGYAPLIGPTETQYQTKPQKSQHLT